MYDELSPFSKQHVELNAGCVSLTARLGDADPSEATSALFALATTLQAHLLHEHLAIGELVSRVRSQELLLLARESAQSAEFISEAFAVAAAQWTPEAALANRAGFRADVGELLGVYQELVRREEEELFPRLRQVMPFLVDPDEQTQVLSARALRAAGLR